MPTKTQFRTRIPSYRSRKGYGQALVTLTNAITGRRRGDWLSEYGSAKSREQYHRVIAAWEAGARRLPKLRSDDLGNVHAQSGLGQT